ncbi:MAG: hypothetical protein MZV64_68330 [Ignavibacteriales bacterium]|nr:hypothetical protein [Ignavibacteriales bacterium]
MAGAITVTIVGLIELGGMDELYNNAGPGFFSLWKPMSDPNFPWTGIIFGAPILGVWYDGALISSLFKEFYLVKDINHSRRGSNLCRIFETSSIISICNSRSDCLCSYSERR